MKKKINNITLETPLSIKIHKNNDPYELSLGKENIEDKFILNGKEVTVTIDIEKAFEKYLDKNYIIHSFDPEMYKYCENKINDIREPGCFIVGKKIDPYKAKEIIQSFKKNNFYLTISDKQSDTILHPSGHLWYCSNLYKYPELHEILLDLIQIIEYYPKMEFIVNLFNCQVFLDFIYRNVSMYPEEDLYRVPIFGIHYYNGKFELLDSLHSQLVTEQYLSDTNNILFGKPMNFFEAINTKVEEKEYLD